MSERCKGILYHFCNFSVILKLTQNERIFRPLKAIPHRTAELRAKYQRHTGLRGQGQQEEAGP